MEKELADDRLCPKSISVAKSKMPSKPPKTNPAGQSGCHRLLLINLHLCPTEELTFLACYAERIEHLPCQIDAAGTGCPTLSSSGRISPPARGFGPESHSLRHRDILGDF